MRASALVALALFATSAMAQVPDRMVFQGRLTRTDGQPETAPQNLRFAIYDQPTGGTKLWEEIHQGVALSNGFYTVQLGTAASTPLSSIFTGAQRYLSVSLENQSELLPRLPVSTLPYAFVAADAQRLGGKDAAQFAPASHGHPDATPGASGFLSGADKAKLDVTPSVWGNGLNLNAASSRVDVVYGGSGSSNSVARADHTHALPKLSCTQRSATAAFNQGATAACFAGEEVTGGGCEDVPSGIGFQVAMKPVTGGYLCQGTGSSPPSTPVTAWALCCKVIP